MTSPMDELWKQVYQTPDEDEPRSQLARALLNSGDPRGEFILLQLSAAQTGHRSPEDEKRARSLLKAHANAWLEPLGGALVMQSVVWERGFPVAGALATRKPSEQDQSIGVPALATLRSLDLRKPNTGFNLEWLRRFLLGSPLRGLRQIDGIWRELLVDLVRSEHPWALQRVACLYWGGSPRPGEVERLAGAFEQGSGLPALTELALTFTSIGNDPPLYQWLVTTPVGRRLRTLALSVELDHLLRWLPALADWGDQLALELIQFGYPVSGFTLHRTGKGWTRLSGSIAKTYNPGYVQRVREVLSQLGPSLDDIQVDGL